MITTQIIHEQAKQQFEKCASICQKDVDSTLTQSGKGYMCLILKCELQMLCCVVCDCKFNQRLAYHVQVLQSAYWCINRDTGVY